MRGVLCIILLLSIFRGFSQLNESWLGHYEGDLATQLADGSASQYTMQLDISKKSDSLFTFKITYGEDSLIQVRDYQLIWKFDNQFMLDEQNGILIDMTLFPDRLVSVFEVGNSWLHVSYIKLKKGIRFELTSSMHAGESGGNSEDDIPIVYSFTTGTFQSAYLKKSK